MTGRKLVGYLLRAVFLGAGLALVGALVWKLGPAEIWKHVRQLGWASPLILLPYAVLVAFDTIGWAFTFPPGALHGRAGLWQLYLVRIAGEAVNTLTPTASLGGEPVKAAILRRYGVPGTMGLASVIADKTMLVFSQILFMFMGAGLLVLTQEIAVSLRWPLVAVAVLAVGFVSAIVYWQRHGLFAPLVRVARRLGIQVEWLASIEKKLEKVDSGIRQLHSEHPSCLLKSAAAHFVAWILGVGETWLILTLIRVDVPWTEAFIIESLGLLARSVGQAMAVPGGVGAQEGGGVLIFKLLGQDPIAGFTLVLLKRVRELFFTAVGVFLLSQFGLGGKARMAAAQSLAEANDEAR